MLAILGPKAATPTLAAARMQRWAIVLSAYDYCIEYRRSEQHSNCDALSRLPHEDSKIGDESEIYSVSAIDGDFPITAKDIGKATRSDPLLSRVLDFVLTGWPEKCDEEELKPYYNRRWELSCEQNCALCGSRVIIPYVLREKVVKELHWEHPQYSSQIIETDTVSLEFSGKILRFLLDTVFPTEMCLLPPQC